MTPLLRLSPHELPEHPLENAAVAIVVPLHRGVEPHDRREHASLPDSSRTATVTRPQGASPMAMPVMAPSAEPPPIGATVGAGAFRG
jgi:hypothetical protein